jgi:hypothetical protein
MAPNFGQGGLGPGADEVGDEDKYTTQDLQDIFDDYWS